MDEWMVWMVNGWMDGMDIWMNGWMDEWKGGWMDGWMQRNNDLVSEDKNQLNTG